VAVIVKTSPRAVIGERMSPRQQASFAKRVESTGLHQLDTWRRLPALVDG